MGSRPTREFLAKSTEWLPARLALTIMTIFGCMNLYMVRVNLSMSIIAMVRPRDEFVSTSSVVADGVETRCFEPDSFYGKNESKIVGKGETKGVLLTNDTFYHSPSSNLPSETGGELDWNEMIQGIVLASFFYGYVISQIPGGRLAEKYGAKVVFGMSILSGGITAVLTPLAARMHFGVLIALRIIQGFLQGVSWPSLHVLIVRWIPPLERAKFIAFVYNASAISTVITLPLCGVIIETYGWPAAFYITGGLSLVWCLHWYLFMHDFPKDHPRISLDEREYIEKAIRLSGTSEKPPAKVPWKKLALSLPLWAIIICDTGNSFGFSLCVTHIPTYMKNILGYSMTENGFISASPFLSRYLGGILAGTLGDWLLRREYTTILNNRRIFSAIAMLGPAVTVAGVAYSGCNSTAAVSLLCLTMFLNGSISASLFVNHCDIAPNFSGTLMGIANTGASAMAFVAPTVAGVFTNNQQTITQWQKLFWLCVPVYGIPEIFYLIFVSGTIQEWNYPTEQTDLKDPETKEDQQ